MEQHWLVASQHSWGQTDIELLTGDEARRRFPYLSGEVVSCSLPGGRPLYNSGCARSAAFQAGPR